MSEQGAGMINSWSKIRLILKSRLGKNIFKNWIESIELVKIEKKSAFFNVPNSFIANWIDRNYRETIIETFKNEEIFIDEILFEFKTKNPLPFSNEENIPKTQGNNLSNIKIVLIIKILSYPPLPWIKDSLLKDL